MKTAFPSNRAVRLAALALLCTPALAQSGGKSAPVRPEFQDQKTAPALAQKLERSTQHVDAPAQEAKQKPALPKSKVRRAHLEHSSVLYRQLPDVLWARGASYKASFGAQGLSFVPFLGSTVPQDFPLALRLESARAGDEVLALETPCAAAREGDVVTLDRGALSEVYRLAPDSLEQEFVLQRQPGAGDLALRIAVESELTPAQDADGIRFANEYGSVRYGRATVVDAHGERLELEETLADGRIGIDVPAAFLARASYPVTIDPVVTTFAVADYAWIDSEPDVAYDVNSNTYAVVYEEYFSFTDSDVYAVSKSTTGVDMPGSVQPIDVSLDDWEHARIADNRISGNFLVVAADGTIGTQHSVLSCTYSATGYAVGFPQLVCDMTWGDQFNPVVGGDPAWVGPTYFLVVWERYFGPGDIDIIGRLVDSSGVPYGSPIPIENSAGTVDDLPAVSKSDGQMPYDNQVWTVAWRHQFTATDHDIYAAQLSWNGAIVHPTYTVAASSHDEGSPAVSSPITGAAERSYMVAYERSNAPGDRDLYVDVLQGNQWKDSLDVSAAEGWSDLDQLDPSVDSDGSQFIVTYAESFYGGSNDLDVFASYLGFAGNQIVLTGQRNILAFSGDIEWHCRICAQHSGGATSRDYLASWQWEGASDWDVNGAILESPIGAPVEEFCFGTVVTCPCGNAGVGNNGCANSANAAGAHLGANGYATVGSDSLQLQASGLPTPTSCLFFQGTAQVNGIVFGDGLRCVGGTLIRLGVKTSPSGTAVYPQAGDVPISTRGQIPPAGAVRYYQGWYRNQASFCTPYGYNVTNAVKIAWLP